MSPALIEIRTPTLPSPQMQNPNPEDRTFSSSSASSSLFDFSNISSNTMNLNVGNGASAIRNPKEAASFDLDFDRTFVSPFASRRGSEEPQLRSVSGRSMPRLMKVRKNAGSQRARSRSVSEAQVDAQIDFNPFLGGSASVDDNSAMQELRDRYRSWNPFQSVQKSKGSNSSANSSVSGDIEGSKPDDTGFVFGASCSSSASNSFTEKNNFMGESMGLPDEIWKLNIRSGIGAKDADKGRPFVFGSNSKSQSGLEENPMSASASASNLPDEMRKLNMEDLDAVDRTKETKFSTTTNSKYSFVFESSGNVAGMDNGNAASSLPDEMRKLNIKNLQFGVDDETKGVHSSFTTNDKSSFVFGSSGNAASANTNLPDKLKKLNIEETTNVGGFEKVKDGNFCSNVHDKKFVFGSNKSDFSSSVGTSASILPEEMKKLNIEGFGVGHKSEEAKNDGFTINRKDPFVFGSKKDVSSASRSTMNKLPDEMKKLNIEGKIEDPGDTPAKVFPSSTMFEKNSQRGKSSDSTIHEPTVGNSIPTSFSFNTSNTKVGASPNTQSDDPKSNEASMPSYSFSSTGASFKSATSVFEAPTVDRIENKAEFSFTSTVDQFGTTHMDFKTPKPDPSSCSAGNFFVGLDRKLDFSVNKGSVKDTKVKKKRGKVRRPASVLPSVGQNYRSRESSSQENPESPGRCSPMDFSPYQETLAADPSTRGTSVTSDEYFHFDGECPATEAQRSVSVDSVDEDLITATQSFGISEIGKNYGNLHEEQSRDHSENGADAEFPSQEFTVKEGSETSESKPEDMDARSDTSGFANEFEAGFRSNMESKENDGRMQFCFKSSSEDFSGSNFTFAASTSGQGHVSSVKRQQRKKNRSKASQDSYNSSSNATMQFASPSIPLFPLAGSSFQSGNGQNKVGDSSMSERKGENKVAADKGLKQGHIVTAAAIVASQEACEKWRFRGNQAYANGNLLTAEEYYTRGVNCVSVNETSKGCLNALVLCYSNRAAARMSAGRMREALMDCTKAAEIDPDFVKVLLRAANCHLALGETKNALKYFKNCVPSGDFVCLDRKIVIEASNGLQKAQHVADYLDRCAELLRQRTSNDAEGALQLIAEALSISPYSENLIEMKAEALFMLRRYDEVIQLCEQSLDYVEKNFPSEIDDSRLENMNNSGSERNSMARFWRWPLIARSYFNLGRLKESLSFLERLEQEEIDRQMFRGKDASAALAATIRELLCHKAAGNEAFQSGRHAEAVEHYTSALSCNIESRPFAAICFCNRAAAYQALGQITDAIADCSLAIALDGNYAKAISRRSTLHEMIRDYGQAAVDLQRLVSLNEKQVVDKSKDLGKLGRSNSSIIDIRQVSSRLSSVEEEERKGISLNFYLILGIESSATASDIKKAYRKAALRHHPDKAGQFLARNDNGDDKLWKEIAEEIHKDADRLFKMIGEAYAILSDPSKRSQYDFEEIRTAKKKVNECSNSRAYSDYPNYPFERSGSRQQWKDARRSYRNQQW